MVLWLSLLPSTDTASGMYLTCGPQLCFIQKFVKSHLWIVSFYNSFFVICESLCSSIYNHMKELYRKVSHRGRRASAEKRIRNVQVSEAAHVTVSIMLNVSLS